MQISQMIDMGRWVYKTILTLNHASEHCSLKKNANYKKDKCLCTTGRNEISMMCAS
jgi:hypothetical protein